MLLICLFLSLFMDGVSGAEIDERVVMEGDYVTLLTNLTEIQNDDTILWMFGPKDSIISQIARKQDLNSIYLTDDVRFRGRLQVDQNTGSLTIRNIRIKHSGQYKLSISRVKTTIKIFNVTVIGLAGETDGVKSLSVMEGDSVTLKTDVEVQRDDLMAWRFGDKGILLAKIDVETNEISLNNADERFRDRVKLDQTGSLIITNTNTKHSGLYELQIKGRESSQRFLLSVTVELVKGKEGGSATLKITDEIQKDDLLLWMFGPEKSLVAIKAPGTYNTDEKFKGRVELHENGSLTISNIKREDLRHYKLQIVNSKHTTGTTFNLAADESVKEGKDKTLQNNVKIPEDDDLLLWMFGAEKSLVAIKPMTNTTDEVCNSRVKVDENGSLTISNIQPEDFGHYKLQIINSEQTTSRKFKLVKCESKSSKADKPMSRKRSDAGL